MVIDHKLYVKLMYLSSLLLLMTSFCQCQKSSSASLPPDTGSVCFYNGIDTCKNKVTKAALKINLDNVMQTVHSFGASDGWTCKFIGKWTSEAKKNKIADLLFSKDTSADGSPVGIGLSLWRFNIGAGSFEQGDSSKIATDWRREECFLNPDGSYNWTKQAGQQWFLQAARQRGVPYTLGFALSPPVYMTKNGKAFNGTGGTAMNIRDGFMDAYAGFLAQVTKHFGFNYVSPVNEPQWTWGQATGAAQEGTQATNTDIATLVKLLSPKLSGTSSAVVIGEAGQLDFLYGRNTDGRGDQISQFFSPSSGNYIGNLPNVAHTISAHSYFTTCPDDQMINIRNQVAAKIQQVDPSLQAWQSEFGILGNICGLYNGAPRNTSIDYGLYVAKVIHHDLTVANVTSWQWWLGVSPYDYSDALVYINDPSGSINVDNCRQDGIVLDSKQLWSLGNYSRFIRPGMQRVSASIDGITDPVTAAGSLMVSAFKDTAGKKLVVVVINMGTDSRILQLDPSVHIKNNIFNSYLTNYNSSLKKSTEATGNILINARSVVTLTGEYQ